MNIYRREMKAHYKSVLIWAVAMFFLITAGITKYNVGVTTGINSFTELMESLPKSLQNLFGVGVLDVSNIVEYFGILYLYIQLVLAIQACMLGTNIITKEERDKTTEFLLVKPISRTRIITAKIFAGLTIVVLLNVFTWISTIVILSSYTKEPYATDISHLMIALLALQILFFLLGTMTATFMKKFKLASPITTGILMIMF
ncbi:MAG: ABC transporter permease subunit, partial [Mobilitalea sp.]